MKDSFNTLISDKFIRLAFILSVILICIHSTITVLFQPNMPPVIPFFNSFPWGIERLMHAGIVMVLPPALIGVFLVNNIISLFVYKRHTLIARILSFNALLVVFLGFLAYLQIVLLVF